MQVEIGEMAGQRATAMEGGGKSEGLAPKTIQTSEVGPAYSPVSCPAPTATAAGETASCRDVVVGSKTGMERPSWLLSASMVPTCAHPIIVPSGRGVL